MELPPCFPDMAGTNDKHKAERGESARLVSFRILPLRDDCARMFQAPLLSSPFHPSPASARRLRTRASGGHRTRLTGTCGLN
jgi:hypothetical protein